MRNFALIVLFAMALINCKSVESQRVSNLNISSATNSTKVEIIAPPEDLLKNLTKKQKAKLDENLPPKDREILDKADEIDVYYIYVESKGFGVLSFGKSPNAGAKVSDADLKKQFLESFYYDIAVSEGGAGCFSPRHKIVGKYKNKIVDIDVCYQCGNFEGNDSNGHLGGSVQRDGKSAPILSKIIEKYGTQLQQNGN